MKEVVGYHNMPEAFGTVLHGPKWKRSRQGRFLLEHREEAVAEPTTALADGSFRLGGYRERDIREYGKRRRLQILSTKGHIAVFAVMSIVDRHLQKRYTRTTGASIRGCDVHDLTKYMHMNMVVDPGGTRYVYKFDIHRFCDNARQDFAMRCFCRVFEDEKLLTVLERFVTMLPEDMSFRLQSSQGAGNLLLPVFLDCYLKDKYRVRHYYRYCDSGLVLGRTKAELRTMYHIIHGRMEMIDLEVKPNEKAPSVEEGIDSFGYVIHPNYVRLRKRAEQKLVRKMHEIKLRGRRRELTAFFYGMAKYVGCNKLFNKLTGKEMRSFKELNVAYKPEDGRKRFLGTVVSIRELVNLLIIVKDFETGIKMDQGDDRCIVSVEQNGGPKKFFADSEEMKNILAQIREVPGGFPFETAIRTKTFGKGHAKYIFT